jgi:hypothetical protein
MTNINKASWLPTRKWFAAFVTGCGTIATAIILTGFTDSIKVGIVGFLVERAVSYITPNAPTPGGVPLKK